MYVAGNRYRQFVGQSVVIHFHSNRAALFSLHGHALGGHGQFALSNRFHSIFDLFVIHPAAARPRDDTGGCRHIAVSLYCDFSGFDTDLAAFRCGGNAARVCLSAFILVYGGNRHVPRLHLDAGIGRLVLRVHAFGINIGKTVISRRRGF